MRILYLGDGTSVHLRRWISWFAARGHEVHLVTRECAPIPGVGITVAPLHEGAYRPRRHLRRAVAEAVRNFRPDIVHAHYVQAWGHYAALARVHPLVVSAWGSDIAKDPEDHWYARAAARRVVRSADLVHVGDGPGRDRVVELGGGADRCFVQPWGVDTSLFSADRRDENWRRSVTSRGGPVFLANRHLHELFRHEVLLNAASELRRETSDFSVVLVGGGPEEARLRALAKDSALDIVHFTGRVPPDEMPRYYASADVYVDCFAAQAGGHGASLSLFEAMACGLPVIVANRPGLAQLVADAGFLVPPDDSTALAEAMRRFIDDPTLSAEMGHRAVERAHTTADRDRNLREFETRMEELIATRSPRGRPVP